MRRLGGILFVALAVLTLTAFAVTRAARSGDDLVNTVELSPVLEPGGEATVAFTLPEPDGAVDVLIIEGDPESDRAPVRALALGTPLEAGRQELTWDGLGDDGEPVQPGLYALRVVLGEMERDVLPPGRICVPGPGEAC